MHALRNHPFCALNHTLFYNLSTPRSIYLHPADYLTVIFTILFTKFQPEAVEEVKYIEKQHRQGHIFPHMGCYSRNGILHLDIQDPEEDNT